MSSRAGTVGTQGSAREVSRRCSDVVPTGWAPVGTGNRGGGADEAGADNQIVSTDRAAIRPARG